MSEIILKSFLGQDTSFLKGDSSFSFDDLLNTFDAFESLHLDSDDRKIIEKIILEIKSTNTFPIWWSEQESTYISKISNKEKSIRYIIFRYKFRNFPSQPNSSKVRLFFTL